MSGLNENAQSATIAQPPTMIINAPPNYEQTHELQQCPLCDRPNPVLDMYLPVREFGYFDMCLYTCGTICECEYGAEPDPSNYDELKIKPHSHKFSAKHELLIDSEQLKIYDRTHAKGVW